MARVKVRARAIDMLGRQQIAGIPTAMHELFKNAHDAYAANVRVDFYRDDQLLIIRDDGLGMSRDEFESRWLTVGTESKVGANFDSSYVWTGPRSAIKRPITGEKGIGRLAIAAIGPQVLVMTRAIKKEGLQPLVVSYIHWGLFEIPGIDLESIDIPVLEIESGALPNADDVSRLIEKVRSNVKALGDKVPAYLRSRILAELCIAEIDPSELASGMQGPSLGGTGYGTHFWILPCNPVLEDDIELTDEDLEATPLEKVLLGFSNTMLPGSPSPAIISEFWDHRGDGTSKEIIGESIFFTPEEFSSSDHHVQGEFDEYGQFSGTVSVYKNNPTPYTVSWPGGSGKKTQCGAFTIRFGYVQGQLRDSRLPPDQWAQLSAKLNKIGGLYIYRDGIRILPYGNSDFDFLGIERRRTKSAQDWFFSYRRMLGAVEISYRENGGLVEKAGREGFRTNRAYREFVDMLENIFKRLAYDFFRPTAQFGDEYNTLKAETNKEAELLKKREKASRVKKSGFKDELSNFFRRIESGAPSQEAQEIINLVSEKTKAIVRLRSVDRVSAELRELEKESRAEISKIKQHNSLSRPKGVGLTKSMLSDWDAYAKNAAKISREVIGPLESKVESVIRNAAIAAGLEVDRRGRILSGLEERQALCLLENMRLRREISERLESLSEQVISSAKTILLEQQHAFDALLSDFNRVDTTVYDESDFTRLYETFDSRLNLLVIDSKGSLESLSDQILSLNGAVSENSTLDAVTDALETQVEGLRDQVEIFSDLAQSGMALGIVQHEFGNTVRRIRTGIRKLKPWAEGTPELVDVYTALKEGFEHLDVYLGLFTPLSRRLGKDKVELSGEEIKTYLDEVFGRRLKLGDISLVSTPKFDSAVIETYPSTILPVFVNLVDNAIHWLGLERIDSRRIKLNIDEFGFLVSNNGPAIPARLEDRIFDYGESAKPGGRGIGLYISRQALIKEKMDLQLIDLGANSGPVFRILFCVDDLRDEVST